MNFFNKIKRLFKHDYIMPSNNVSKIKFLFAWEYGFLRFIYFFITRRLRTYKEIDKATGFGGAKYSKKAFYDGKIPVYRPNERVMWPIFFLNSIPLINKNDLLVIGPRYETEILIAKSFGFRNIIGLDTYPRGGDGFTPGSTSSELNQRSGGSFRVVINTKDWDNSFATNSPGQSGNPKSKFYKNLYEDWANDRFFPLLYSKNKVLMNLSDRKVYRPSDQSE